MMKRKRPWVFNLAARISLGMLAILALGCFFDSFGIVFRVNAPGAVNPFHRDISAGLERGRMGIRIETWEAPLPGVAGRSVGTFGSIFDLRLPDRRRATWEFDAHTIPLAITKSSRVFIFAMPIWCLALPCGVMPFLWLRAWIQRRRQLRDEAAGFPIAIG